MYKKINRKDINKENMVTLSYCQCQKILKLFGEDYKIGYNAGVNGWNYDLYCIHDVSIVTGYNVPYQQYNNQVLKRKLIALDNKLNRLPFGEYHTLKKEFLKIFE